MTMGPTRRRRLAVVLLVVGLTAALAPTATARVTVEMTVDGTTIQGGETITVTDDPAVGVDVEGDEPIRSVTVRVDGEARRSFEPNATNVSERFTLDLTEGDHAMSVVVDGEERLTATIRKDSTGPLMTYTSPFESTGQPRNGEVSIERADTTLAIEFDDSSGVREVRIERTYEWQSAGGSQRDLETARIENPGDNVSHPLLFGLGENELHVVAIDVHGQRRTHDITVRVFDSREPVIDLERFERTDGGLHVAGTVRDDVKVDSLSYRIEGRAQKNFMVNPTSAEPTRSRTAVDFEFTAQIDDGAEGVVLEATDVAGNEREWMVPLDYRGHIAPRLTIAEAEANGRGVDVVGTVTDGRVTRVVIESVGSDGTVVDSRTVYDGTATDRVEVQERLDAAGGETTVVLRAVDADGRGHRESVTLSTPTAATPTEPSPTRTPTPTATTTATPIPTPTKTTAVDGPETTRGWGALSTGVVAVGVLAGLLIAAARRRRR
jgi:hypothetical protein